MIFVFDRDIAGKALIFEFLQNRRNVGNTFPVRHIVSVMSELVQVFQMAADDPAFENAQAIDRFKVESAPNDPCRHRSRCGGRGL